VIEIIWVFWGLGIGDWGLGIGDWAQSPIPNPQSPIFTKINLFLKCLFLYCANKTYTPKFDI
jgi:hypothetical protein